MSNATVPTTPIDMPVSQDTLLRIGPIFFGVVASFWLFGISTMQLYVYYLNFPKDSKLVKISVYIIFLLDIIQSVCVGGIGWKTLGSGWGREKALLTLNWSFRAIPVLSGIVAAWVQMFYAWRIYVFGRRKTLPIIIVLLALAQCAAAIAIIIIPSDVSALKLHKQYKSTIIWLGGAALADITIAVSMLYILFVMAKRSNVQTTQRAINRLVRLTVETGVATATCAILELIMYMVFSHNNLHLFFATVLCKVYSNAFMTSVNSRAMREREGTMEVSSSGQYNSFGSPLKQTAVSSDTENQMTAHVLTAADGFGSSKQPTEKSEK